MAWRLMNAHLALGEEQTDKHSSHPHQDQRNTAVTHENHKKLNHHTWFTIYLQGVCRDFKIKFII